MAGLNRLGMSDIATGGIEPEDMLPAIAQGAIGIEWRIADDATAELLAPLHDTPTGHRLAAERAFLAALDGSCETPIAGLALIEGRRDLATRRNPAARRVTKSWPPKGALLLADGGSAWPRIGGRAARSRARRVLRLDVSECGRICRTISP